MSDGIAEPALSVAARPPSQRLIATLVSVTMFMAQLDGTIIVLALPQMALTFDANALDVSIGISIYLMVQAILLPASNWVSDRFGTRRVFACAVLLFTLSSAACGFSTTLWQFVLARIVQGASAALMMPVGRVVLVRATRREDLVHVLALTAGIMLLAPTLGPPIGGFIVTYMSWPWVFFLNVPFGLACFALILRAVPDLRSDERRPFDLTGFVLGSVAMGGLIYGFDRISTPNVDRVIPAAALIAGFVAGYFAVRHSLRAEHPLLSLAPMRHETFRISTLSGGLLARIPLRSLTFILPLMFQIGMGFSAFVSGILVMAMGGADLVVKPLVRKTLQIFGFRGALLGSLAISSIGGAVLAVIDIGTPLALIFVLLAILGVARSILFSGMSTLVYVDVTDSETGAATVLWNVMQQVTNAFAISFSVIGLNLLTWSHGTYGDTPQMIDFRIVLLLFAALGVPALLSFWRLAPDAGAELSGHRPAR